MARLRRGLVRATDVLLPLACAAGALALVAPSAVVAERSDIVLAALVLFTALTIAPSELAQLRARRAEVTALVLAPFAVLVPLAWVASRPFDDAVSDGVLALGVASTEIAAIGLVALAAPTSSISTPYTPATVAAGGPNAWEASAAATAKSRSPMTKPPVTRRSRGAVAIQAATGIAERTRNRAPARRSVGIWFPAAALGVGVVGGVA